MKGIGIINLGEKLITTVNKSPNTKVGKRQIKQFQLNTEDLMNLVKKNDRQVFESNPRTDNDYTFGRYLYDWYSWVLDVSYKEKSNYEVLALSLKKDGNEVLKGAYSKSKVEGGEIKKFHITENCFELQTGHTNKKGKIEKSTPSEFFPEKLQDYIWSLEDKSLLILSDYFGIFGKSKAPEEIGKQWGIKSNRVKEIKKQAIWRVKYRAEDSRFPAIKETEEHKYTIKDYIDAIRHLENNKTYDYIRGRSFNTNTIIDDEFLKEVGKVRKSQDVISEWRMTRKKYFPKRK